MTPSCTSSSRYSLTRRLLPSDTALQVVAVCLIQALFAINSSDRVPAQDRLAKRAIEGRVTNADGKPIKGAAVEWGYFMDEKEKREVFRTDADGNYRVETTKVGPDFRLGISAAGFAPVWRDGVIPPKLDAGKPLKIDFKLPAPISLRGKVVDRDGKPIAGVTVVAKSPTSGFVSSFSMPTPSYPFPGPARESTTNADGEFLIRYLPTTSVIGNEADKGYAFEVSVKTGTGRILSGKAFSKIDNEIAVDRSSVADQEELDGVIRGKVLDAVTNEPIENFRIVLRFDPAMHEFTNAQGEFRIEKLRLGRTVQMFVYAKDYAPFVVQTLVDEGGTIVQCQLKHKPSLTGVVVDTNGKPISGATMVIGFDEQKRQANSFYWDAFKSMVDGYMRFNFVQRLTTNDDGRFQFGMVKQHPVIAVMAPGFARQVRFIDASEVETLYQSELRIELEPESVLAGSVKMNGVPVANASLRLTNIDNWDLDFGEIKADAEGRFSIGELPAGNYYLSVYQTLGASASRLTKKIVLHKNQQITDLVLDNPGGNSSLSGKADPFAIVYLTPKVLDGLAEIEYTTIGTFASPEGEFEITGLHPGTYICVFAQSPSSYGGFRKSPINREVVVNGNTVLKPTEN